MSRSFKSGLCLGMLAPLACLAGIVFSIYRFTGKVPFPVSRPAEGELLLKLVPPEDVPGYWRKWRAELEPIIARICAIGAEIKARCGLEGCPEES